MVDCEKRWDVLKRWGFKAEEYKQAIGSSCDTRKQAVQNLVRKGLENTLHKNEIVIRIPQ
jgi:hypothetical protein